MATASLAYRAGLLIADARRPDRAARWIAIATAVAFHVVLVALLLSAGPARHAARAVAPIVVDLIASIDPPRSPPRPKPLVKPSRPSPTHVAPPEIVAPPAESPAAIAAPLPPEPTLSPPIAAALVAEAPPPVPTLPPRFNADYLQNPAPQYPPLARRMREQGKVILRVLVDADGLAEQSRAAHLERIGAPRSVGAGHGEALEIRSRPPRRAQGRRVGARPDHFHARRTEERAFVATRASPRSSFGW